MKNTLPAHAIQISQVQQAEMFREQDEIVDHLRFYSIVVSPNAGTNASL